MPLSFFVNTFAGNPLDRRSDLRLDADWLAARRDASSTRLVGFWNGQPLIRDKDGGLELVRLDPEPGFKLAGADENVLFLGLDGEEAVFAIDLAGDGDPTAGPLEGHGKFMDLRFAGGQMSPEDAGMAATAKALFEWKRRHGFCSACGQPSQAADAGWKRICPACKVEHFPRTDPVTIMLPTFQDHCLLGRQAPWPKGRFSTLAGFMEPGESIEAACAREVKEEAGLTVVSVRYHSSQPWPFPTNLMIGLIAEVSDQNAAPDQTELEEVRWFSRAEMGELLAGKTDGMGVPPPFAIAHQLMKAWAHAA
jgi:NAD+ diphosphatase